MLIVLHTYSENIRGVDKTQTFSNFVFLLVCYDHCGPTIDSGSACLGFGFHPSCYGRLAGASQLGLQRREVLPLQLPSRSPLASSFGRYKLL